MENILKAIESSQHCQRNWDLDKTIDPEHLEIFKYVLKTSPSKQNIAYYKIHFIFNRELIEKAYYNTVTGSNTGHSTILETYNPQVLANLLVVFENYLDFAPANSNRQINLTRNSEGLTIDQKKKIESILEQDRLHAVGIAAGQLTLVANYLGYKTGFCKCFDEGLIEILGLDNRASLMIGIGYPNTELPHSIHQLYDWRDFRPVPKVDVPFSYRY